MRKHGSGDLKIVRFKCIQFLVLFHQVQRVNMGSNYHCYGGYHEEVKGVSPCYSAVGPD